MKKLFLTTTLFFLSYINFAQHLEFSVTGIDSLLKNEINKVSIYVEMNAKEEHTDCFKNIIKVNETFTWVDISRAFQNTYGMVKEKAQKDGTKIYYFKYPSLKVSYQILVSLKQNHVELTISNLKCKLKLDSYTEIIKALNSEIYYVTHFFEWAVPLAEIEALFKNNDIVFFRLWSCTDSTGEGCSYLTRKGNLCPTCEVGDTVSKQDMQDFINELKHFPILTQHVGIESLFNPLDGLIGFDSQGNEVLFIPICYNSDIIQIGDKSYFFITREDTKSKLWKRFNKNINPNFKKNPETDLLILDFEHNINKFSYGRNMR